MQCNASHGRSQQKADWPCAEMCQTTTGRSLCQICSDFQATGNHALGEVTEPQQTQKNKRNEVVVGVHVEAMANPKRCGSDPSLPCSLVAAAVREPPAAGIVV